MSSAVAGPNPRSPTTKPEFPKSLLYHPHIHCVVLAGGISLDRSRWIRCCKKFFLPVRVLSRLFRGKLLAFLRQAFARGELELFGRLSELAEPARFHAWLESLKKSEWVVYAKPPLRRSRHVLKYLARYTHRVAISNGRLGRCKGVAFASAGATRNEFLRHFLLQVLPRPALTRWRISRSDSGQEHGIANLPNMWLLPRQVRNQQRQGRQV